MHLSLKSMQRLPLLAFAILPLCALPARSIAQDQATGSAHTAPDNSGKNRSHRQTADQQPEDKSDIQITAKIRRAIIADKALSMYGHNVKIMTQSGAVTLKGPVHSDQEKQAIAAKAAEVVGPDKVTNQITISK